MEFFVSVWLFDAGIESKGVRVIWDLGDTDCSGELYEIVWKMGDREREREFFKDVKFSDSDACFVGLNGNGEEILFWLLVIKLWIL